MMDFSRKMLRLCGFVVFECVNEIMDWEKRREERFRSGDEDEGFVTL